MENQIRKWVMLLAMVIVLGVTGCYYDVNEAYNNFESQYYSIDPATILKSLDQGDMDVFKLLDPTPRAMFPTSSKSFSWSQADYLRVAQALYHKFWQDPFETQNIYSMDFSMNCEEVEHDLFNKAELQSFVVINTSKEEIRREYRTYITPSANLIFITKEEYTPNINKKVPIDIKQYRVSAEEAVRIAEKSGGVEKRSKYRNDCTIHALAPGSGGKGWSVSYSNNHDGRWDLIFEIVIDPQSGTFDVLFPK